MQRLQCKIGVGLLLLIYYSYNYIAIIIDMLELNHSVGLIIILYVHTYVSYSLLYGSSRRSIVLAWVRQQALKCWAQYWHKIWCSPSLHCMAEEGTLARWTQAHRRRSFPDSAGQILPWLLSVVWAGSATQLSHRQGEGTWSGSLLREPWHL